MRSVEIFSRRRRGAERGFQFSKSLLAYGYMVLDGISHYIVAQFHCRTRHTIDSVLT